MSGRIRRRRVEPRQGEVLLEALFRRLKLDEEARRWRALAAWHQAVGTRIAGRTRAERVRGRTLVVRVSSAAWSNELGAIKSTLLMKLRATRGGEWLEDLRFSVGPLGEAPDWREPVTQAAAARLAKPDQDPAVLDALQDVDDPALRRALLDLYVRSCSPRA